MRITFSPRSVLDLEEIGDYIARDNPQRAVTFLGELEEHCHRIRLSPLAFPLREDLAPTLRMAPHGNYVIFFDVQKDTVRIERILHGARRLQDLF
jgi:toxin ParE1/3/4